MNAPAWLPWVMGVLGCIDVVVLALAWRAGDAAALAQEGMDDE